MRIVSASPPPAPFEVLGGKVVFYANIEQKQQTDTMSGREITLWEYDSYTLPVKGVPNLTAQIDADYYGWMQRAVDHEYTTEAGKVRALRDQLLNDCDVRYCNPELWSAMGEAEKQAWREYKQALRDIPEQEGFPFSVGFPLLPAGNT